MEMEMIIQDRILELIEKVKSQEKITLELPDFDYSFLDRVEQLSINSGLIYPDEDLPVKFGVTRGYNGGGIHSGLSMTSIDRMTKNRQAKAGRILGLFAKTFWSILKDFDEASEQAAGEPVEIWNSATI